MTSAAHLQKETSMLRSSKLIFCTLLVLTVHSLEAESPGSEMEREFGKFLWPIAEHIHRYYVEEIPPDSLMSAGVEGLFYALDPASDYTLKSRDRYPFQTFLKIARSVDQNAFYAVSADTLVRFGIAGMMGILDPYTVFMEKRNLDNFNIRTKGHYGGLGFKIQVVYPDSAIAVWSLLHDDTPAARSGVKSGDLIIAIEDSSTKHMSAGDAADLMRGKAGTATTLTLSRAGKPEPFDLTIMREEVSMHSVPYHTLFPDSTGYVKLERFQQSASRELRQALEDLQSRGMERLILDLQYNGGGYLPQAVEVADLFLDKDKLVVFHAGRAYQDTSRLTTREDPVVAHEALIVLVNEASASASEIVAGAIQDWDRGLVLGMPTVGKGSVQQIVRIDEKAELKLTTGAYFTPSGRSIDKRMRKDSTLVGATDQRFKTLLRGRIVRGGGGITPDIETEDLRPTRLYSQLAGGRSLNNRYFHFSRQYVAQNPELSPDFRADADLLRQFRDFVEEHDFDYVSEAEDRLDDLEEASQGEEYEKLEKSFQRLKKEIDKIEERHWDDSSELIQWRLTFDILEKAFGLKAATAYQVAASPRVQRARDILSDPQAYQQWFEKIEIGGDAKEAVAQDESTEELQP